jgi:L-threonylcarbamoyladenylate synthase
MVLESMKTRVRKLDPDSDCREVARETAACLASGGLVVFPTETVYGLGANAADPAAIARLRDVKQRSDDKPFTVHIGSRTAVERFVPDLAGLGRRLTQKAWPGPLTLIFHVSRIEAAPIVQEVTVPRAATMYHNGTIGIRCPDDQVASELLNEARIPVVAASANPAGAPAPVDAEEALRTLEGKVDLILDAGRTRYARPSTIVRVDEAGYSIVREGVLDERTIRRLTQVRFLVVCSGNTCRSAMAEGLLRHLLAEKLGCSQTELSDRGYFVESAGTGALPGAPPSPGAVKAMSARGIDISAHRSQPLTNDLIQRADYIFAMTGNHAKMVVAQVNGASERTHAIDEEDIEDPIGGDDTVYVNCAERIAKALTNRLKEIAL